MRNSILGILAATAFLLAPTPALSAEEPEWVELTDLRPVDSESLFLDGRVDLAAGVYYSQQGGCKISLTEGLSGYLVVSVRTPQVCIGLLQRDWMTRDVEGNVRGKIPKVYCNVGTVPRAYPLEFMLEGKRVTIGPKPDLVGWCSFTELVGHSPKYLRNAQRYRLDEASVRRIAQAASAGRALEIRVFFSTTCHYCEQHLPKVVRLQQELVRAGVPNVTFSYCGMPTAGNWKAHPEAVRWQVDKLPTVFVGVGGGWRRIERDQMAAPERLIAAMLP